MAKFKYKTQMYQNLYANIKNIYADAAAEAKKIGIPEELAKLASEGRGTFGLTGGVSGARAALPRGGNRPGEGAGAAARGAGQPRGAVPRRSRASRVRPAIEPVSAAAGARWLCARGRARPSRDGGRRRHRSAEARRRGICLRRQPG